MKDLANNGFVSIRVSAREFDNILAALRARQGTAYTTEQEIEAIASEHGEPLTVEEIDALCVRINEEEAE